MICDNDVIELVSKCPKLSILVSENTDFFQSICTPSICQFQFTDLFFEKKKFFAENLQTNNKRNYEEASSHCNKSKWNSCEKIKCH